MTVAFAIVLGLHGLIHLLGFVKAFGIADLAALTQPVSPGLGLVWLLAGCLFLTSAVAVFVWPRGWWAIAACAISVSMFVILHSWVDARFGAVANLIALVGVVFGFLAQGPVSLRAEYEHDVARGLARVAPSPPITDADLAHLPDAVQRYLRGAGVVGQPRIYNFHVRMHGRIRSGRDAAWMPLTAEQYTFVDQPERLFYLNGSMFMIPVQGYHRYVGPSATMRVKAAALVPVVTMAGEEMNRGETVTMFNDLCVMAPGALIDPAIVWEAVDARTTRATFTNAGHTIRAALRFNDAGELADFYSDDRYQTAPDGKRATRVPWSTPLRSYRPVGPVRLAALGEGRWHESGGEYTYIELSIDDVQYNVKAR